MSDILLDIFIYSIGHLEGIVNSRDPDHQIPPTFNISGTDPLTNLDDCAMLSWFGRLRLDADVEKLAGSAPIPPIMRPIEMTLVQEKVYTFHEAAIAMRHALNLCVLLANQRALVRNTYTLRVCLLHHLFVRVIPLPMPINHPERDTKCFWHAQDMRYETQADILRLVDMLGRHFATATLSGLFLTHTLLNSLELTDIIYIYILILCVDVTYCIIIFNVDVIYYISFYVLLSCTILIFYVVLS